MTLTEIKIFRYQLPLAQKLFVHGQELAVREGLILQMHDEKGYIGFGEISPLPGLSRETLAVAQRQILRIKNDLLNKPVPKSAGHFNGEFAKWLDDFRLFSSVRFGIETAILNLRAAAQNVVMAQLIDGNFESHVYVNALLNDSNGSMVEEAKELVKQGFRTIKIKVGTKSLEEDIQNVKAISQAVGNDALLRLDANQAWSLEQAVRFGEAVGMMVEFIEEPLKDINAIPEFYDATTIPVALDESLIHHQIKDVKSLAGVEVVIVKPTLQGGLEKSWHLIQEAKQVGLETVISSAFETGLGILTLANLAACFERNIAVGLDTRKWFARDLLLNNFPIEKGHLDITQPSLSPLKLDFSLLTEIAA